MNAVSLSALKLLLLAVLFVARDRVLVKAQVVDQQLEDLEGDLLDMTFPWDATQLEVSHGQRHEEVYPSHHGNHGERQVDALDGVYSFYGVSTYGGDWRVLGYFVMMFGTKETPDRSYDTCLQVNEKMECQIHIVGINRRGYIDISVTDCDPAGPSPGGPTETAGSVEARDANLLEQAIRNILPTSYAMETYYRGRWLAIGGRHGTLILRREERRFPW